MTERQTLILLDRVHAQELASVKIPHVRERRSDLSRRGYRILAAVPALLLLASPLFVRRAEVPARYEPMWTARPAPEPTAARALGEPPIVAATPGCPLPEFAAPLVSCRPPRFAIPPLRQEPPGRVALTGPSPPVFGEPSSADPAVLRLAFSPIPL